MISRLWRELEGFPLFDKLVFWWIYLIMEPKALIVVVGKNDSALCRRTSDKGYCRTGFYCEGMYKNNKIHTCVIRDALMAYMHLQPRQDSSL